MKEIQHHHEALGRFTKTTTMVEKNGKVSILPNPKNQPSKNNGINREREGL